MHYTPVRSVAPLCILSTLKLGITYCKLMTIFSLLNIRPQAYLGCCLYIHGVGGGEKVIATVWDRMIPNELSRISSSSVLLRKFDRPELLGKFGNSWTPAVFKSQLFCR